jgi:hypothetical protein
MTILWIVDGQGWGHDIQSKYIAERLPQYDHYFIPVNRSPKNHELYCERIRAINADLIVAMHPAGIPTEMSLKAVCRLGMKTNGVEILS